MVFVTAAEGMADVSCSVTLLKQMVHALFSFEIMTITRKPLRDCAQLQQH